MIGNRSFVVALLSAALVAGVVRTSLAESEIPAGLRGFSGQVRGVVVGTQGGTTFTFKVARLLQTWKNNTAENAELIVGRTMRVVAGQTKGEDGQMRPVELHAKFIAKVQAGQEMTLELRQVEGSADFRLAELTKEQRAWAQGEGALKDAPKAAPKAEGGDQPKAVRELTNQVKELQAVVRELKTQMEALRKENAELRAKLAVRD